METGLLGGWAGHGERELLEGLYGGIEDSSGGEWVGEGGEI